MSDNVYHGTISNSMLRAMWIHFRKVIDYSHLGKIKFYARLSMKILTGEWVTVIGTNFIQKTLNEGFVIVNLRSKQNRQLFTSYIM